MIYVLTLTPKDMAVLKFCLDVSHEAVHFQSHSAPSGFDRDFEHLADTYRRALVKVT